MRPAATRAGAAMDLMGGIGLSEDTLLVFSAGVGAGVLLCAALGASLPRRKENSPLSVRVAKLEMRLAAGKNFPAIAGAVTSFESSIPGLVEAGSRVLLADAGLPRLKPSHRADPEEIAREFGEAMRDNTVAAVEIAKAIIDQGVNLNDAKDRRRVADKIRTEGKKLSTGFWDKYGELMLSSSLPENLKDLLRVFFAQVKRLKTAVTELVKEPTFADLDALLDRAIDLLDTAKAIIDELERLSEG